eukprot:521756-Rhodomonas_salina.1
MSGHQQRHQVVAQLPHRVRSSVPRVHAAQYHRVHAVQYYRVRPAHTRYQDARADQYQHTRIWRRPIGTLPACRRNLRRGDPPAIRTPAPCSVRSMHTRPVLSTRYTHSPSTHYAHQPWGPYQTSSRRMHTALCTLPTPTHPALRPTHPPYAHPLYLTHTLLYRAHPVVPGSGGGRDL